MNYAIGIDIGGTKLAAGIVDQRGAIHARQVTHSHAEESPAVVIDAVGAAVTALLTQAGLARSSIYAVGVGFPGNTNGRCGIVLSSSNLPDWDRYPLRDALASRIGLPVILDNDTNLGALGEYRYGAGRNAQSLAYVTMSTGYGMGIIIEGKIYTGYGGMAGEVGHVVIDVDGPLCSCGKRGCVMAYASGIGISRMVYEAVASKPKSALQELVSVSGRRVDVADLVDLARSGDADAAPILRAAGYYAGIGLSIVVQTLNPERIVIGGGLLGAGSLLTTPMHAALREHCQPAMYETTRIVEWQLGDDIGILGGAALAFQHAARS